MQSMFGLSYDSATSGDRTEQLKCLGTRNLTILLPVQYFQTFSLRISSILYIIWWPSYCSMFKRCLERRRLSCWFRFLSWKTFRDSVKCIQRCHYCVRNYLLFLNCEIYLYAHFRVVTTSMETDFADAKSGIDEKEEKCWGLGNAFPFLTLYRYQYLIYLFINFSNA